MLSFTFGRGGKEHYEDPECFSMAFNPIIPMASKQEIQTVELVDSQKCKRW